MLYIGNTEYSETKWYVQSISQLGFLLSASVNLCKLSWKILVRVRKTMAMIWDPKWITSLTEAVDAMSTFWLSWSNPVPFCSKNNNGSYSANTLGCITSAEKNHLCHYGCNDCHCKGSGSLAAACAVWKRKPAAAIESMTNWEHRHKL